MGGYDIGASFSGSSSATSGLEGNFSHIFGDTIVGGKKVPVWLPFAVIAGVVVVAVVFLVRR